MSEAAPNPALIFETLNAFQKSAALHGAIELDLFTGIARGHATPTALAAWCEGDARAVRILCDYLVVHQFLAKRGQSYALTPTSAAFLDRESAHYMGSIARFVHSEGMIGAFRNVAQLVRRGTTLLGDHGTTATEYDGWVDFAHCMTPLMMPAAEFLGQLSAEMISGPVRVLDIAAGHGMFGIRVAQRNPQASIVALDWEPVLRVAWQNAQFAGVDSRYKLLAGDAMKVDFDGRYGLVLVTNFLHHFDMPTCVSVMRKIRESLTDDGVVLTLEFVPNEDRVSPPAAAAFGFTMLGTTPAGDAYTYAEYVEMWKQAGLERHELRDVPNSVQRVIVSRA